MPLTRPIHLLRNIKRLNRIVQILAKYGFGYIIDKTHLDRYFRRRPLSREAHHSVFDLSAEVRVRKMFEDLGPAFIKLGQILSTRSDLIPIAFCKELEKLQDQAPAVPFREISVLLEKELGRPLKEAFRSLDTEPLGSASISQIHSAVLPGGEKVVLKVLKPGVRETINADLDILLYLARLLEKYFHEDLVIDPVAIVRELRKSILKETNFRFEAKNILHMTKLLLREKNIVIPAVYKSLSTERVLVLEKMEGVKITDREGLKGLKADPRAVARLLSRTLFRQIFILRVFHGDPHPGNIMFMKGEAVGFMDFGLLGRMDELSKNILIKMLQAFLNRDTTQLMLFLKKMVSFQNEGDEMDFQIEMEDIIDEYYDASLSEIDLPALLQEVFDILTRYRIRVPSNLFLLMRALLHLESIVRTLEPGFELVEEVKPFLRSFLAEEYSPARIFRKMKKFALSLYELLNILPARVDSIIEKMERGRLKVQFELLGVEAMIRNLYRIVNRLIYSIISASLIIGSFFVLHTDIGPRLGGYPLFSLIGFFMAFLLLALVLFDIVRTRSVNRHG